MDEWLQLSEEDLERAQRLTQAHSPAPGVLKITMDDLASERPPEAPAAGAPPALVITAGDLIPAGPQPEPTEPAQVIEQLLWGLVNQARHDHLPGWLGSRQLNWHPGLAAVARGHSADMIKRQYVDHASPEGKTAAQRISAAQIKYIACGENIGIVYGENSHTEQAAYDIHAAFMNQPRSLTNHRGNILNPIWTHVGIGVAYNPDGALVATQNFISAPGQRPQELPPGAR